jgi:hypothetical protein
MTPSDPSRLLFSPAQLAQLVAETVPAGRRHAVVTTLDDQGFTVAGKLEFDTRRGQWDLVAAFRRDYKGDTGVGAQVVWSW